VFFGPVTFGVPFPADYGQRMPGTALPIDGTQQGGYFKATGQTQTAGTNCWSESGVSGACTSFGTTQVVPGGYAMQIVVRTASATTSTFTVVKNDVATGLTCSTSASTTCTLTVPISFEDGDLLGVTAPSGDPGVDFIASVRYVNR
jgi:hypothetical protein